MKDHTINFSSQASTLSSISLNPHRLYLVTGKGGVGKTSFALALTQKLRKQGIKAFYNSFDQPADTKLAESLNAPVLQLDFYESAEDYVAMKLGSKSVAKWIMKTPFFKSLLNILPGLNHLIFLGHLLYQLEEDPDLHVVIDSPSTGHALSILQSTHNFKKIFKTGLLVKDIERMHGHLYQEDFLKIYLMTLPSLMSVQETQELVQKLKAIDYSSEVVLNDLISLRSELLQTQEELPEFLANKLELEKEILTDLSSVGTLRFPHFTSSKKEEIIKQFNQDPQT